MKSILLSSQTFHGKLLWRLATFYGPMHDDERSTDICTYTRACLRGYIIVLLITTILCGLSILMGATLGWATACLVQWTWVEPDPLAGIMPIVLGVMSIAALFFYADHKRQEWSRRRYQRKLQKEYEAEDLPPSGFQLMWQAWKQKLCISITIE